MKKSAVSEIKSQKSSVNFYVVSQVEKDNELLFIHPFKNSEQYLELLDSKKVSIISDCEVEMDLFKKIKSEILQFSYSAVAEANSGETWLIRSLISLFFGIFVFFVVLLIPDPVPLVDEFSIGSLGGALFFYFSSKLGFFNFTFKKVADKHLEKVNYIKIIQSNSLKELNIIFSQIYDSLTEVVEGDFVIKETIKKHIKNLDILDRNEVKKFIKTVGGSFSFSKILPNTKKYKKEIKKSLLSERRFNFYYLLFEYFLN